MCRFLYSLISIIVLSVFNPNLIWIFDGYKNNYKFNCSYWVLAPQSWWESLLYWNVKLLSAVVWGRYRKQCFLNNVKLRIYCLNMHILLRGIFSCLFSFSEFSHQCFLFSPVKVSLPLRVKFFLLLTLIFLILINILSI